MSCNECVVLRARIVELESQIELLEAKQKGKYFCCLCPIEKPFASEQKVKWHIASRHPSHFGLPPLDPKLINCNVQSKVPKIYQTALCRYTMINYKKYYTGKTKPAYQ